MNKPHPVVLDTNAVLDWLVFLDPGMQQVGGLIAAGALRWLVCAPMRDELAHVLTTRPLGGRRPDAAAVLQTFDRWGVVCATPARSVHPQWQCSDADDQIFLDLALAHRARWLISHDRALLRLARRAQQAGLLILRPRAFPGVAPEPG